MNAFYENELKTLRNLRKEFDSTYKNAELDFDSEQLLAGLASLTARIREEMAETEDEIARDFVESVAPNMLLHLPARALAEVIPSPSDNLEREIPNGALLLSKNKGGKPFFWRTIGEHKLKPAQKIISARGVEDSEGFDCIEFESSGCGPWIIYIDSWDLWYFMLEHARPYVVAEPQNPWELCRDFFCFEEKFRYIYMEDLPEKLRFTKKIPKEIFSKISAESFKLNVLPVENSFEQNLEPVLLESGDFEARIFPNEERQVVLYLKEVLAGNVKKASFEKIEYRYNSGKIRFANLPQNADALSVSAFVCDGVAASNALEAGSALNAKNSAMEMCEIRSVMHSLPFLPRVALRRWEILGLLQKNYLKFFEEDALKNALEMQLCNPQGKRNYLASSIKNVFAENKNAVYKGCILPKMSVKIVLSLDFFDTGNYEFLGVLKAYGGMLLNLFKKIFICNMLVELILRIEPFGMEQKWE